MWFEFSAEMTERVEQAEQGNVPLRFYNLKSGCYQGIHTCEGDLVVICNSLADYADILMEFVSQSDYDGLQKALYEVHAERCRKISLKLQEQIGYDRQASMERCRKKRGYYGEGGEKSHSDVGEDALVMMVKKSREKMKGEVHEQDIRGDSNNGGSERTGEQSEEE